VALFRLLWGRLVAAIVVHPVFGEQIHRRSVLLSSIFVFNNIVIPCLVVAFSDPSCFVDLFTEPSASTSTYTYPNCELYLFSNKGNICLEFKDFETSVVYYPSFIYNFQCGTSLIKAFEPLVLVSYMVSVVISGLMICLANLDESLVRAYVPAVLRRAVPAIIRGADALLDGEAASSSGTDADKSASIDDSVDLVINLPREVALLSERLVMLLSFGLVTPYVAVVCGLSSLMLWLKLGFLLSVHLERQEALRVSPSRQSSTALAALERACSGVDTFSSRSIWAVCSGVSALFVGCFAIDISADDSEIAWYYSLLFLVVPCALVVLLMLASYRYHRTDPLVCDDLATEEGEEASSTITAPTQGPGQGATGPSATSSDEDGRASEIQLVSKTGFSSA